MSGLNFVCLQETDFNPFVCFGLFGVFRMSSEFRMNRIAKCRKQDVGFSAIRSERQRVERPLAKKMLLLYDLASIIELSSN